MLSISIRGPVIIYSVSPCAGIIHIRFKGFSRQAFAIALLSRFLSGTPEYSVFYRLCGIYILYY